MKRILAVLSVASLVALGCSNPTAPVSAARLSPTALLDCGSNTNNSNNPPQTAGGGSCNNNNNNNNNNNSPQNNSNNPPATVP